MKNQGLHEASSAFSSKVMLGMVNFQIVGILFKEYLR